MASQLLPLGKKRFIRWIDSIAIHCYWLCQTRIDWQVCRLQNLGGDERRQRYAQTESALSSSSKWLLCWPLLIEFSGTLLGFDDYVSTYISLKSSSLFPVLIERQIWSWKTWQSCMSHLKKAGTVEHISLTKQPVTTPETKKSSPRFC